MEERQRLKRQDPDRTGPIRNWSTVFRNPESQEASDSGERTGPTESRSGGGFSDSVTGTVKLAYRVVDENIRLGQRVAQQINDRTYDLGTMRSDFHDVTERTLRSLTDLAALWLQMLGSLIGVARPAGPSEPEHTGHRGAAASVDVDSTQPVRIRLDLQPRARDAGLTVYALHALDPASPPLTDVGLEPVKDDSGVHIRLRVPPAQPPGQYSAVVVDATGNPCGTLAVRVGEPAGEPASTS